VLARVLNWGRELGTELGTVPAPITAADMRPLSRPSILAFNTTPQSETTAETPNRRRKPVRVGRLYPERQPEPLAHAWALLRSIQVECPQLIGTYVPHVDLDKAYKELCGKRGLGSTQLDSHRPAPWEDHGQEASAA
jgi:hypothetical protein